LFYLRDRVRGGRVAAHVRELTAHFADPEEMHRVAGIRLARLIEHARSTTAFYAEHARGRELSDLPVISKPIVKSSYDGFFSRSFARDSLIPVITSGSYGTPFTFHLTPEKRARMVAEVIFFGRWSGYDVGVRHGYVRVTDRKSRALLFMQNEVLIDPRRMTQAWFEEQRRRLKEDGIRVLIGYTSGIAAVAAYCHERGDSPADFRLEGVITMAEPLLPGVRSTIESAFGCKVLSRYATEEFGVLANEHPTHGLHCVNAASYVVELLARDSDAPVAPGEMGRVVVTDLFSYAFPLIRYDTGDLAALSPEASAEMGIPVISRLEGRAVEEITNAQGDRVSPYAINVAMRDVQTVRQFQFVQKGERDYVLNVVPLREFTEEPMILERFRNVLGPGAEISIQCVPEIPALPSGKRPYIRSEFRAPPRARAEHA